LRWDFSDAFQDPREKNGKAELRLSLDTDVAKMSLGNDNGAAWGWPFFRARRVTAPGSYTFESMRYPGAYLCTSDMKVLGMKPADWGSVKLVLVRKSSLFFCFTSCAFNPKDASQHCHARFKFKTPFLYDNSN